MVSMGSKASNQVTKGSFGSRQSDSLRSLLIKNDQSPSHPLVTRIHTRLISDLNPIEDAC